MAIKNLIFRSVGSLIFTGLLAAGIAPRTQAQSILYQGDLIVDVASAEEGMFTINWESVNEGCPLQLATLDLATIPPASAEETGTIEIVTGVVFNENEPLVCRMALLPSVGSHKFSVGDTQPLPEGLYTLVINGKSYGVLDVNVSRTSWVEDE